MRIFILLFMLAPLFLWGQYPDNPRKLRLGFQTTGAGLTYIKDGAPAHTPGDDEDAWMVLDTANNVLYYWDETAGAWENILDDITQDTVFQITNVPDTTTLAPMQGDAFINASADTLGLYNGDYWVLFFGGSGGGAVSDTTRFFVYAPAHGLEDSISAYGYVPVKADFTKANSSTLDSTHFAYAVGAPHVDTLELKLSGPLVVTAHGLIVGRLYYLQDDGTQAVTPGTVRAPTVYVLDANTVVLTEVGADQDQVISRQAVPSPVFTFWGGDPQNPSDSIMQIVVDSVFAPAGLAKPSTIFFMSYSSQSKNPTYQDDSPTDSPLNPSHSWFYDGNVVTRMNHLLTSVDLQATSAGLFTLDTVMLVGGIPTDSTVADWLDTNYVQNNLRLPNGAVLYWQGEGNPQSPDYSWMVVDDITNTGESNNYKRILKRLRSPVDSTIYATRTYADSLFIVADSLRAEGDKSAPILVPVFDRNTQLDGCSTAENIYTGFLLLDNEAIDEGSITFEINASPATVTYDVYNADSTSYYFETSASRGAGVYFWEVSYTDADGNNVGDTNAFDVVAGTPDSVLTVVQDSILVLRVCGVEISRDTLPEGNPGTVTSVALSLPSQFTVSGSPVTSAGTLSGTWATQAANTVLAGPTSGGAAAPTFRSLVAADITAGGGALGTGSAGQVALWNAANSLTGNANMTYSSPVLTLAGTGNSLLLTPTSAGVNTAGKWYTSSTNRPRFMDGTTDWPLVRGSAESFTTGSILFAGTSGQAQQDNSNLFFDDTNNRFGIGTPFPQQSLHVEGNARFRNSDLRLEFLIPSYSQPITFGTLSEYASRVFAGGSSGMLFQGFSNNLNAPGVRFQGHVGSVSPAVPSFTLEGFKWDGGTGRVAVTSNEIALGVYAGEYTTGTKLMSIHPAGTVIGTASTPARTLHVTGEMRVTDLTTDTPTRIVGADADGDFGEITPGSGVTINSGTFNVASIYTANASLTGNRDVNLAGSSLRFRTTADSSLLSFNPTTLSLGIGYRPDSLASYSKTLVLKNYSIVNKSADGTYTNFSIKPTTPSNLFLLATDEGSSFKIAEGIITGTDMGIEVNNRLLSFKTSSNIGGSSYAFNFSSFLSGGSSGGAGTGAIKIDHDVTLGASNDSPVSRLLITGDFDSSAGGTSTLTGLTISNNVVAGSNSYTAINATSGNVVFGGTGATKLHSGTTAQRPGSPVQGDVRANTDNDTFEGYDGTKWQALSTKAYTPTSTADSYGSEGDITYDDDYIYIKTSAGWKRSALSTF